MFVPRDDAFWRLFVQDATAPDPFMIDDDFRLETLLGHLTVGRIFSKDLVDGKEFKTMANKTIKVQKKDGGEITRFNFLDLIFYTLLFFAAGEIFLYDGRQQIKIADGGKATFVYNLGNIFFIDKVLFTETSDVLRVMEKNQEKKDEIIRGELGQGDENSSVSLGPSESGDEEDFAEDFASRINLGESDEEEEEQPLKEDLVKIVNNEQKKKPDEVLAKDSPRTTRRELASETDEESFDAGGASIEFSEYGDIDYETKVIFVNNQKVSIVRQKQE